MKATTSLAILAGALAVLAPLAEASHGVPTNYPAVRRAPVKRQQASTCAARRRKHHHKLAQQNDSSTTANGNVSAVPANSANSTTPNVQGQKQATQLNAQRNSQNSPAAAQQQAAQQQPQQQQQAQQSNNQQSNNQQSTNNQQSNNQQGQQAIPDSSGNSGSFEQTMLSIHNQDRAMHSAQPLTWDDTLASAAQSWASKCQWEHTPNNPYGQNIAAGTGSNYGAADAANMWYNEISQYNFGSGQYSDATGHFTQMVWAGTSKLGCAIQACSASQMGLGSSGSANFVVCNYDAPGNIIGEFLQNVFAN